MTEPTPTVELRAETAPTPAQRISRTAGQTGGVTLFVELWLSFGWFGADHWTAEQAAKRWPTITAVAVFVVAVVHNAVNWWRSERQRPAMSAVTVSALPTPEVRPAAPAPARAARRRPRA